MRLSPSRGAYAEEELMTDSHDAIPSALDATSPTVRTDESGVRPRSSGTKPRDGERTAAPVLARLAYVE